jgi:hypothetical protein
MKFIPNVELILDLGFKGGENIFIRAAKALLYSTLDLTLI